MRKSIPILGLLWLAAVTHADVTTKRLAPGVTLTQEIDRTTPLIINVVSVDLSAPGVRVGVGIGRDRITGTDGKGGREDVAKLARRLGAVAAVNADYFPYTGDPLGVGIQDGELFSEPFPGIRGSGPRVTLGVTPDGKGILFQALGFLGDLQCADGARAFVSGIDRSTAPGEIVVYSSLFGPATANKAGGVEAVISGVNLPVRANKLLAGRVESVEVVRGTTAAIPEGGVVFSGGPGAGAEFLAKHLHPGDPVSFVLGVAPVGQVGGAFQVAALPRAGGDLPSRGGTVNRAAWEWAAVPSAVGGGPRLLTDGQVTVDWAAEGFEPGFADGLNPRTAAGTTRDGRRLLLVTVDGRQASSQGVSLDGMAQILKRYGAWNAINLDGGGSTTMAADGLTVSSPGGDGSERPVADMLLVYSDRAFQPVAPVPPAAPAEARALTDTPDDAEAGQEGDAPRLVAPAVPLRVGVAVPLRVQIGGRVLSGVSPGIVWQGPAGGVGFVNQKGYLITTAPGVGTVAALYGGRLLTARVTVQGAAVPAASFALRCHLAADPFGLAGRSRLVVRITDKSGKPLAHAAVAVSVSGGAADAGTLQTDFDGSAVVGITWAAPTGGAARITSGTLTPVTLTRQ